MVDDCLGTHLEQSTDVDPLGHDRQASSTVECEVSLPPQVRGLQAHMDVHMTIVSNSWCYQLLSICTFMAKQYGVCVV